MKLFKIRLLILIIFFFGLDAQKVLHATSYDTKPPEIKIGLALSGGGFRSAAFAHGAMLALDGLHLCVIQEKKREKKFVNHFLLQNEECPPSDKNDTRDEDVKFKFIKGGPLIQQLDFMSTVSGGSVVGAYHILKSNSCGSEKDFRLDVLHKTEKYRERLLETLWRTQDYALIGLDFLPLFPGSVFATQKVKKVMNNGGFIDIRELGKLLDDEIYDGKTFEDLECLDDLSADSKVKNVSKKRTSLLIHATDLNNERMFTFPEDLKCLVHPSSEWKKERISTAVAASSGIPGLFSPLRMQHAGHPAKSEKRCLRLFGDKETNEPLLLVDGGVYDNLAVDGLVRQFINFKTNEISNAMAENKDRSRQIKLLIISINAEVPSAFTGESASSVMGGESEPGIEQIITQSFNVLMNQRSQVSQSMVKDLQHFGIHVVDVDFRDIYDDKYIKKLVQASFEKTPDIDPSALLRSIQSEEKKYSHLTSVDTLSQTPKQIDGLISAGQIIMANQLPQLRREIKHLLDREYRPCPQITDLGKNYCWPSFWEEINIFDLPMRVRVAQLREVERTIAQPNAARIFWRARRALEVIGEPRENFGYHDPTGPTPLTLAAKILLKAYADQKLKNILPNGNDSNLQQVNDQASEFIRELNEILFRFAEPVYASNDQTMRPPYKDQNANLSLESYNELISQVEKIEKQYIDFFKGEWKADAESHCRLHQFLYDVKESQNPSDLNTSSGQGTRLHSECKNFDSESKNFYHGKVYADTVIRLAKTLGLCEGEKGRFDHLGYCFAVAGNLTNFLAKVEERMVTIESEMIIDGLEPLMKMEQIVKINGHWKEIQKLKNRANNMFHDGYAQNKMGAFWVKPFLSDFESVKDSGSDGYNARENEVSMAEEAFEYKTTLCSNDVPDELQQLRTWYIQQLIKHQMAGLNNFAYVSALYGHTTPQVIMAAKAVAEDRNDTLTARENNLTNTGVIEAATAKTKGQGDFENAVKENGRGSTMPAGDNINVECGPLISGSTRDVEKLSKDEEDALNRRANFLDTYGFVQFVNGNQKLLKVFFDDEQKACKNEGNILDKQKEILLNVTLGISQYREALNTVTDQSLEKKIAQNFRTALALVGPVIEALNTHENKAGTEFQRLCLFDKP